MQLSRFHIHTGKTTLGNAELVFFKAEGDKPGPTLFLVSGIHGNETSSVGGLVSFLKSLAGVNQGDVAGKIIALPFANLSGLCANRLDVSIGSASEAENLNRAFPGRAEGTPAERIAHAIFRTIGESVPDVVIDLHTMNTRSISFTIVDRVAMFDAQKIQKIHVMRYARSFGFVVAMDLPYEEYEKNRLGGSLSAACLHVGIPSFTVEVPGGSFADPKASGLVKDGIWKVAAELGILSVPEPSVMMYKNIDPSRVYSRYSGPKADFAGFFVPNVKPGESVSWGQIIGTITDMENLTGYSVCARNMVPGVVSDIADASFVSEGDKLFELLVPEE